ncbi:NUDIX domain-containing protein [Nocardia sp. 2]|uniref:NUDIX domain-containing protein n=1 Tax=Nocardia acididurans TaxID=2802282 RepID=A0ABS1M8F3_9NOCA|nr:NUDIX domain-containing protein [Nocardia acididurans]MBL1076922.1 NUDIX domain-containing protein [Nocardia acididurans]
MQTATAVVADLVTALTPWDERERDHIAQTLAWLGSTDDIFRRIEPVTPSPHLVTYMVLVDPDERGIYLGMHRKAGLFLPMGGHVEPGEHPLAAAQREVREELGIEGSFDVVGERPLFLSVTAVPFPQPHVDISLWHVIRGNRSHAYSLDPGEFDGGRWWPLDAAALPESDPHLPRFVRKLDHTLRASVARR